MVENKQDVLARVLATLPALRKNIDDMKDNLVLETYVREFHTVLDRLDGIGINVSEFRVPDSEVKPRVPAFSSFGGRDGSHVSYTDEKYVDKSFILIKLDAILGYFEIITSEKPKKMGFTK